MSARPHPILVNDRRRQDPLAQWSARRHLDRETGVMHVKIGPGEYYVTKLPNRCW